MELKGRYIALLAEELYEEMELWYPYYRLIEAGATVEILGTGLPRYQGKHGLPVEAAASVEERSAVDFDAVVIPGGYAPDRMRRHPPLLAFVRTAFEEGRLIAFICHAGWVPISAGILKGRRATSYFSIRDDMRYAGAEWVDAPVVRDGNLISSRHPGDLPDFCRGIIAALTERP